MKQTGGHGIFYILIPITAIILLVVINFIMDAVYQKKLERDTLEVINYIITKDFDTPEEYRKLAQEQFEDMKYTDYEDYIVIRLGHEYMVFMKYHPINDLKTFLNIFKFKWTDKDGYLDDNKINEGMDRETGTLSAKYIIYLNEYREPVIIEYSDEKEKELEEKEKEKYPPMTDINNISNNNA